MEDFTTYYPLLVSIARRMLGQGDEAEDLVQESYIRYVTASVGDIQQTKAYLTAIVTRLCLDRRKSARAQREQSLVLWLASNEPPLDEDLEERVLQRLELQEEVARAFQMLLEYLSPAERACFLLHDIFAYSYQELAASLGRQEATCRQLVHRARARLRERRPRFHAPACACKRLLESFLIAAQRGEHRPLLALLREDITRSS